MFEDQGRMSSKTSIIVIGNEKGGTGKSTISMHLAVALLGEGARVGIIDLDARQGTLSRYVENRQSCNRLHGTALLLPELTRLSASGDREADNRRLADAVSDLKSGNDVLIVDTPGSATPLSQQAHSYADILITPLNDSFVDLDVLARIDPGTMQIERPSHYAETVWEGRKLRAMRGEPASFDWVVMRNRLSNLDARNKREVGRALDALAKRIGFRLIDGLSERVIYRELFLAGLTLLDYPEHGTPMSMSHVAARQELRNLSDALGLGELAKNARKG